MRVYTYMYIYINCMYVCMQYVYMLYVYVHQFSFEKAKPGDHQGKTQRMIRWMKAETWP